MQIRIHVIAIVLLFAVTGIDCVAQASNLTVLLDPSIKSEAVQIKYMLVGEFGGYGGFVRPQPSLHAYDIPVVVGGTPAVNIKFLIWTPGCQISVFDIALPSAEGVQRTYACVALGTTKLVGKVPKNLVDSSAKLTVLYVANWSCQFFGLKDCLVPMLSLGTVRPDTEGAFRIELPDFTADPIASQSIGGAEFHLQFQGANTVPLRPENPDFRTVTHGLKIAPKYPENMNFLPEPSS